MEVTVADRISQNHNPLKTNGSPEIRFSFSREAFLKRSFLESILFISLLFPDVLPRFFSHERPESFPVERLRRRNRSGEMHAVFIPTVYRSIIIYKS